ncbi:hypothetical protein BLA29_012305, partial [Euroglyphus maynei]
LTKKASHAANVNDDQHNHDNETIIRNPSGQKTASKVKSMKLKTHDSISTDPGSRQPINEELNEQNSMKSFVVYEDELQEYLRLTNPRNHPISNDSIGVVHDNDQNIMQARKLDGNLISDKIIKTDDNKGPKSQLRLTVPYEPKNVSRRENENMENRVDTMETTTANSRLANHLSQFIATFNPTQ